MPEGSWIRWTGHLEPFLFLPIPDVRCAPTGFLSALLDRVEAGEEIVITRHGQPIARLVPNIAGVDLPKIHAAADGIRNRARSLNADAFNWDALKADRDAGQP
jgi:antitoxin (DNA-binding transcriptional repressor) of toxin-antitoxin stability system